MSRPHGDVAVGSAPAADDGDALICLVARQGRRVRWNQRADLGDHRSEHLGRSRAFGHERRHAT